MCSSFIYDAHPWRSGAQDLKADCLGLNLLLPLFTMGITLPL